MVDATNQESTTSVVVAGQTQDSNRSEANFLETWQDARTPEHQAKIQATHNLEIALRHLRYPDKARTIWIDALCIEQGSIQERDKQVAIMGIVCLKAQLVVAWVGAEDNNSAQALDTIKQMCRYVTVDWYSGKRSLSHDCPEEHLHWDNITVPLPFQNGELDPVLDLLRRPNLSRVWVRQEITLASNAVLVCGTDIVDWKVIRTFSALMIRKSYFSIAFTHGRWQEFGMILGSFYRLCRYSAGGLTYSRLRRYSHGAECENQRDKTFAILFLLCPRHREIGIQPDYSKPVVEVYTDVAVRVIAETRSLGLLDSCILSSRALSIPSWLGPGLVNITAEWFGTGGALECMCVDLQQQLSDKRRELPCYWCDQAKSSSYHWHHRTG